MGVLERRGRRQNFSTRVVPSAIERGANIGQTATQMFETRFFAGTVFPGSFSGKRAGALIIAQPVNGIGFVADATFV